MKHTLFARGFLKGLPESDPIEAFVFQEGENFIRFVALEALEPYGFTRVRGVVSAGGESICVGCCTERGGRLLLPVSVLMKFKAHPQAESLTTAEFWECLTSFRHPNRWVDASTFFWIRRFIAEHGRGDDWWSMEGFLIPLILKYRLMSEFEDPEERVKFIRDLVWDLNPEEDSFLFGYHAHLLQKSHSSENFEQRRLDEAKNSEVYQLEVSR